MEVLGRSVNSYLYEKLHEIDGKSFGGILPRKVYSSFRDFCLRKLWKMDLKKAIKRGIS